MKRILSLMMLLVFVVTTFAVPTSVFAAEDVIVVAGENFYSSEGAWTGESSLKGPTGKPAFWSAATTDLTATYSAEMLVPGEYEVFYWKNVHTAKNDNAVPLEISHSGGISEVVVDCSTGETGWESVGNFTFSESDAEYVKVTRTGKTADVITRTAGVMYRLIKSNAASSSATAEMDEGDKYIFDLFNYLGITTAIDFTDNAKQVTRAEFLAAVMKALAAPAAVGAEPFLDVPESHAYYNEIMSAKANGIVAGNGLGYFNPDNPIMLEEAAKIAVHSLELLSTIENIAVERANAQGGYKIGYILELNKQGLAKGLPSSASDAPLTVESVKVILMNLLNADIREMITEDKVSVLERVHDIYEGYGKINAVFGMSVKTGEYADKGFAVVDSTRYELGNLNIDKYIGQETDFYYVDKDGTDRIVAIRSQGGTKYLEIDADDIVNASLSGGTGNIELEYYNENMSVKHETVHSDTAVYYNNVLINNRKAEDFKPLDGTVTLVSNSGGSRYDYAFINSYENFVVKNVNETDEKIYEVYNNDCLDLGAYEEGYEIVKDGRSIDVSKVYAWDVLSIPAVREGTAKGKVAKVYLSRQKVSGVIESKNKTSIFVNGTEYELSDRFKAIIAAKASEADKIALEKTATLYLDINGKIAAADEGEGLKADYAYIRQTAATRGLSGNVEIEAFLANGGQWSTLKLADTIKYTAGGTTTKINAEDIVKQDTFMGEVDLPDDIAPIEYTYNPESDNVVAEKSLVVNDTTWNTNSGLKGPSGVKAPYAQGNGEIDFTYNLGEVAPGKYKVSVYLVAHNINAPELKVTVNDAEGAHPYTISDYNTGASRWEYLGVHTFTGSASEGLSIHHEALGTIPGDTKKYTTRASDIELVEDLDTKAITDAIKKENFENGGAEVNKIIEYKANAEGIVKEIKVLDVTSENTNGRYKNVAGNVFVTSNLVDFMIDSSTAIFAFPKNKADEDSYAVIPMTTLQHDDYYSVQAYDEDENRYSPVIVLPEFYNDTALSNQAQHDVMVVTNKSKVLDDLGEEVVAVKGYVGSSEKTLTGNTDTVFNSVGYGDIIAVKQNAAGKVYMVDVLYDHVEGVKAEGYKRAMTNRFTCFYGTVMDIVNGGSMLFISTDGKQLKETATICGLAGPVVLIADEKQQTITPGAVGDISVYDHVAVRFDNFRGRVVVIYR